MGMDGGEVEEEEEDGKEGCDGGWYMLGEGYRNGRVYTLYNTGRR